MSVGIGPAEHLVSEGLGFGATSLKVSVEVETAKVQVSAKVNARGGPGECWPWVQGFPGEYGNRAACGPGKYGVGGYR